MAVYRGVIRDDERFVPYFRAVTPEPELALLPIGSRPARRTAGGGVESLRAIPWAFAWNQTRLLLPAWLGVGEALRTALDGPDRDTLLEMAAGWRFFRTFLELQEMVLAKADADVHAYYVAQLAPPEVGGLWVELRERFENTVSSLLEVLGQDRLLADNPVLRRTITVRSPYVDPLNVLQAELLRRVRSEDDPALRDALALTINGIASGMRNTG
jgi:phosphoenolpyruvate carboxylase